MTQQNLIQDSHLTSQSVPLSTILFISSLKQCQTLPGWPTRCIYSEEFCLKGMRTKYLLFLKSFSWSVMDLVLIHTEVLWLCSCTIGTVPRHTDPRASILLLVFKFLYMSYWPHFLPFLWNNASFLLAFLWIHLTHYGLNGTKRYLEKWLKFQEHNLDVFWKSSHNANWW